MSSNKKNLLKTLLTANAGCGRPKLSDVYEPKPKSKSSAPQNPKHNALSVMENDDLTSTSFSFNIDTISSITLNYESEPDLPSTSKVMLRPCPKIIDSIAVVKDSNDPYQDFRHSMLQMIMEKQIYSKDGLQELLQCFLELNLPCHHDVIVEAFMEIWNQVISKEIVTVQDQELCVVHGEKHGSYLESFWHVCGDDKSCEYIEFARGKLHGSWSKSGNHISINPGGVFFEQKFTEVR